MKFSPLVNESSLNERGGALVGGIIEKLLCGRHFDQATVKQQRDAVGHAAGLKKIVRSPHDGGAGLGYVLSNDCFD